MAASQNTTLSLLHVIEPNPMTDHLYVDQKEFKTHATTEALKQLEQYIPSSEKNAHIVKMGTPKKIVIETADELNSDLIIVGNHGKTGIRALLGSTCNAILHHARRDVLVVHY